MSNNQPGDPDQLRRVIEAAERYYESSRKAIIVFWDEQANRYRLGYASLFDSRNAIDVVRIPR